VGTTGPHTNATSEPPARSTLGVDPIYNPPVSPEDPSGDHAKPFDPNCTQPQIWMAAIDLDNLAAGVDPSYPAFWLPFQDYTAHNHIAQWVTSIPTETCADIGQSCAMGCCAGLSCDTTTNTCVSDIQ